MNYYCVMMFLVTTMCITMRGSGKNPYSADQKQLDRILAITAKQETYRKNKQKEQVAQILAEAKASHLQKKIDLFFSSFNAFYGLPGRSRVQKSIIQQES